MSIILSHYRTRTDSHTSTDPVFGLVGLKGQHRRCSQGLKSVTISLLHFRLSKPKGSRSVENEGVHFDIACVLHPVCEVLLAYWDNI